MNNFKLCEAAKCGNLNLVKQLINSTTLNINSIHTRPECHGMTVFHIAAAHGFVDIIKFLIEYTDIDVNATDEYNKTALHFAAMYCEQNPGNIDTRTRTRSGSTTTRAPNLSRVNSSNTLIDGGESNISSQVSVAKYLLLYTNINPNIRDEAGKTALHEAVFNGKNMNMVNILTNANPDNCVNVNIQNVTGYTALHRACIRGHLHIVKYICEYTNANVNLKDKNGWNPLLAAVINGHFEIVRYFIDKTDIDINTKTKNGKTVLHYAAEINSTSQDDIIKFIIQQRSTHNSTNDLQNFNFNSINANLQDFNGSTILHILAARTEKDQANNDNLLPLIQFIIDHTNIDISIQNSKGSSAIDILKDNSTRLNKNTVNRIIELLKNAQKNNVFIY